jgi:hypothetical protein
MASTAVQPLIALIEAFLGGAMDVRTFERRYLETDYICGHETWPDAEYEVLQELFWAVDAFVADPELRDSPEDLDEDQLRAEAARAIAALRALDAEQQG